MKITFLSHCLVISAVVLGVACTPDTQSIRTPRASVRTISTAHFNHDGDYLNAIDAVVDKNGIVHAFWISGSISRPHKHELWHASSPNGVNDWSEVSAIESTRALHLRTVVSDSLLHLFLPGRRGSIRHLVAGLKTPTWEERSPITRPMESGLSFEAIAEESTITVVYLAHTRSDTTVLMPTDSSMLVVAEISPLGRVTHQTLARFGQLLGSSSVPRLSRWRGELHAVCSLTPMNWGNAAKAPAATFYGTQLIHVFRNPLDRAWSRTTFISQSLPAKKGWGGSVGGLALVATGQRLFMFVAKHSILGYESLDGRTWSTPVQLSKYPAQESSLGERTLIATANDSAVTLAWIDDWRFREVYRIFGIIPANWLPFGDPYYNTTNVLLMTSRGATLSDLGSAPVIRVSSPGYYVHALAMESIGARHHLLWTARPREDKTVRHPKIFVTKFDPNNIRGRI